MSGEQTDSKENGNRGGSEQRWNAENGSSLSDNIQTNEGTGQSEGRVEGNIILYHKAEDGAKSSVSERDAMLRDAVVDKLREVGIEVVTDEKEGQRVLDIVNGENATLSKAQKRAAETATLSETSDAPLTVVSTADGAKVLNNLDELTKHYDNLTKNNSKTFLGDVAKALGAKKHGSNSQYATFETKNGQTITIRLANHNAKVYTFDNHGEDNGISIVA